MRRATVNGLALVFHELGDPMRPNTGAVRDNGRVDIGWQINGDDLSITLE